MDEPGSLSGMISSPMPQRGPLASQRTSLAIFMSAPASVRSDADKLTSASCADNEKNLFADERNGMPEISAIRLAATRSEESRVGEDGVSRVRSGGSP